jgi:hypothetical protein
MNDFEEELQKSVEANQDLISGNPDAAAYREVFRILSKEPKSALGNSFADKLVKKIAAQKKREARRDLIWLSFGVVFLLAGLIVTALFAGLTLELGFLKEMSGYAGVFIFGAAMIVAFNWFEKRILPKSSS